MPTHHLQFVTFLFHLRRNEGDRRKFLCAEEITRLQVTIPTLVAGVDAVDLDRAVDGRCRGGDRVVDDGPTKLGEATLRLAHQVADGEIDGRMRHIDLIGFGGGAAPEQHDGECGQSKNTLHGMLL